MFFLIFVTLVLAIPASNANNDLFNIKSSDFALEFHKQVTDHHEDSNIIISPLSVQTLLGLTYMGSTDGVAEQIQAGLHLQSFNKSNIAENFQRLLSIENADPALRIASKIYINKGYDIRRSYMEIAANKFYSEVENVDFNRNEEAASTMNQWVENKTNHVIRNLFSPSQFDADTRAILVNAIYFKGSWENKFNSLFTKKSKFYTSPDAYTRVDMMLSQMYCNYGEFEDEHVIELPYSDSHLSMLIFLPKESGSLKKTERNIARRNILNYMSLMTKQDVIVELPKFRIEFSTKLNDILKKMNIDLLFSNHADFRNMIERGDITISSVIHKAVIEVNEEGTEAAAVTATAFDKSYGLLSFSANRPFFYAILSERSVIFSGRITNL